MIVDNRPGAGGLLGGELTSKAPPDGYTLKRSGAGGRSPVLRRLDERRPPVERTFA
jgi:tripartite-type tricarboxylate transporter receptor subunit TctC